MMESLKYLLATSFITARGAISVLSVSNNMISSLQTAVEELRWALQARYTRVELTGALGTDYNVLPTG